jgi:hypothetical protein
VPDRAHAPPTPIARAGLPRGAALRWQLGLAGLLAIGVAEPAVQLSHATARARACVASYEAPRGPELPDCRSEIRWFSWPSRVPWTATPARYRAEELGVRAGIAAYVDAAVGRPDAAALEQAAEPVVAAEKVMRAGSQRIVLEELGRAVGAPDLGRSAMLLGDRRTLLGRFDRWAEWSVRLRAIDAALLEGDAARAAAVAGRYAEFDPRDEELRVAVAATLCLGGGAARGLELLGAVQQERSAHRHESWARNWGDVRALMVVCASLAAVPPPPLPERTDAGIGDLPEARAALRLRLLAAKRLGDSPILRDAATSVIAMLKSGPLAPGTRVRVLAALLGSGHAIDPNLAAELARPRLDDGEAPLPDPAAALTAIDWWLDEGRGMRPAPGPEALRDGAENLRRKADITEVSAAERLALEAAAAAMTLDAVASFARAGQPEAAIEALDRSGDRALRDAGARALVRSSAWYVAGDPARALAALDGEAGSPALRAAWLIQRAELLASVGRRDEAARAAVAADEAAAALGDHALDVRARWTRLALAPRAALRAASPLSPPGPGALPWVGEQGTAASWLLPEAEGPALLDRALGFWDAARRASPDERRAIRYASIVGHRGDAPRARVAHLALAGELVAAGEGDVEVWLDALTATDTRRGTLRSYAWTRAEAARWRGDAASAARWDERRRALVKLAAQPDHAELAGALGI